MTASPQTFTITPEQYAALIAEAQAAGVPIAGDSGTASKDGVTVAWTYDGTTLTLTVESRAWYDPPIATIQAKLAALVESVMA